MDDAANALRNRIPLAALGAYAVILCLALARVAFGPAASNAPVKSVPFVLGTPVPATIDVRTVSRGSIGHDGVDRLSTVTPPLETSWIKLVNVGVVGGGLAEPTVDASGVYVGTDTGWLHALNHDGATRWRYFDSNALGGVTGAPATDSKVVYFGTSAGNLVAVEKQTGQVVWVHRFDGAVAGAPILHADSVIATVSAGNGTSYLVRIKASDGQMLWQTEPMKAPSSSGPALDPVSGFVFVGGNDRRVHAYTFAAGKLAWERELDAEVQATPTLVGGQLFVASNGEFVYGIRTMTGEVTWKSLVTGGSRASVTWEPEANVLVVGTNRGMLYGFDRHNGKARWIDRTGTIFNGLAGALAVSKSKKDRLSKLVWTTCADLVVCALDSRTGNVVEKIATLGPVASSPVVYNDALYLVESTGALRKYVTKR